MTARERRGLRLVLRILADWRGREERAHDPRADLDDVDLADRWIEQRLRTRRRR